MRQLGKQQPTAPATGLGFKTTGRDDTAALETGRAVLQAIQEQGQALQDAALEMRKAGERLNELTSDAIVLYAALKTVGAYVRAVEGTVPDDNGLIPLPESPPNVEKALSTLASLDQYDYPTEDVERAESRFGVACPECVAGKHPNCTHEVLGPDDTTQPCACEQAGHGPVPV